MKAYVRRYAEVCGMNALFLCESFVHFCCPCVQPSARRGVVESFVLSLSPNPVSSVVGGARLSSDHVTCTIEPRGLVQFTQLSRDVTTDVTGTLAQVRAVV